MITFLIPLLLQTITNYCVLIFRQYLGAHIKYETAKKCHDYMTLCEMEEGP
jgi:hypothetical protein